MTMRFDEDELVILQNALNYVLNAVDLEEFSTLIGAEREEAERVLERMARRSTRRRHKDNGD